jgi:Na+-transporting methylmalonyl-CoA/oxaloacetate decarboxylase gamma subunit
VLVLTYYLFFLDTGLVFSVLSAPIDFSDAISAVAKYAFDKAAPKKASPAKLQLVRFL